MAVKRKGRLRKAAIAATSNVRPSSAHQVNGKHVGELTHRVAQLRSELETYREEMTAQTSELFEMQARLEESRDRYAAFYDYAPLAYVSLDPNGLIEEINLT